MNYTIMSFTHIVTFIDKKSIFAPDPCKVGDSMLK